MEPSNRILITAGFDSSPIPHPASLLANMFSCLEMCNWNQQKDTGGPKQDRHWSKNLRTLFPPSWLALLPPAQLHNFASLEPLSPAPPHPNPWPKTPASLSPSAQPPGTSVILKILVDFYVSSNLDMGMKCFYFMLKFLLLFDQVLFGSLILTLPLFHHYNCCFFFKGFFSNLMWILLALFTRLLVLKFTRIFKNSFLALQPCIRLCEIFLNVRSDFK